MGSILNIIYVPLAMILRFCYMLVQNYGVAIILFALISKVLMLPLNIRSEKSRRKMAKIQPKLKEIQAKYKGNTKDQKYLDEVNALYKKEGASQMAGCLPMLIQFPLIMGLWNAIRNPLTYICGLSDEALRAVFNALSFDHGVELGTWAQAKGNQIQMAQSINAYQDQLIDVLPEGFQNVNLNFLGLDLGAKPVLGLHITILIPILSALTSFLVSYISNKINNANNQGAKDPTQSSMNFLLYTMPLISLIMAFSFQNGVGIYWIAQNLFSLVQTILVPKLIREPVEVVEVKEKKLNYNQIVKMEKEKAKLDDEIENE